MSEIQEGIPVVNPIEPIEVEGKRMDVPPKEIVSFDSNGGPVIDPSITVLDGTNQDPPHEFIPGSPMTEDEKRLAQPIPEGEIIPLPAAEEAKPTDPLETSTSSVPLPEVSDKEYKEKAVEFFQGIPGVREVQVVDRSAHRPESALMRAPAPKNALLDDNAVDAIIASKKAAISGTAKPKKQLTLQQQQAFMASIANGFIEKTIRQKGLSGIDIEVEYKKIADYEDAKNALEASASSMTREEYKKARATLPPPTSTYSRSERDAIVMIHNVRKQQRELMKAVAKQILGVMATDEELSAYIDQMEADQKNLPSLANVVRHALETRVKNKTEAGVVPPVQEPEKKDFIDNVEDDFQTTFQNLFKTKITFNFRGHLPDNSLTSIPTIPDLKNGDTYYETIRTKDSSGNDYEEVHEVVFMDGKWYRCLFGKAPEEIAESEIIPATASTAPMELIPTPDVSKLAIESNLRIGCDMAAGSSDQTARVQIEGNPLRGKSEISIIEDDAAFLPPQMPVDPAAETVDSEEKKEL